MLLKKQCYLMFCDLQEKPQYIFLWIIVKVLFLLILCYAIIIRLHQIGNELKSQSFGFMKEKVFTEVLNTIIFGEISSLDFLIRFIQ